ncbi:uncharacterized protein TNCT_578301 [Trichonephila clavata]|uniref:Uncharacterized protein n=1 Tax=Trichonephila clavata TaxID=2740835 RepID=A0A8X6KQ65_TRICU|nr:uncharacterized protein TNCT_578301 [Trichonephila clavata]
MTSIEEPGSHAGDPSDQSITMEDVSVPPLPLSDEKRCAKLIGFEKQAQIFDARKDYVISMIEIEKKIPSPSPETTTQLENEMKSLEEKIKFLEGKMTEFLLCPIALCTHNYKFKAVKRPAEPLLRPAKLTAGVSKNPKIKNSDFSFPKKTTKPVPLENSIKQINTTNSFTALNIAKSDAKGVTPPPVK